MVFSVDGHINGPGGEFIAPAWSADLDTWTAGHIARHETMLFGRAAWERMATRWPAVEVKRQPLGVARFGP